MTINVNSDLCSQCGICSKVCPMGIIDPANEVQLPRVHEGMGAVCLSCGHCEAFCPSGALTFTDMGSKAHESVISKGAISPENLGLFLKSRRSIRTYKPIEVPHATIESILDIVRYAPSGGNRQLVEWLVIHDPHVVREIAEQTIDWEREVAKSSLPMASMASAMVAAWDKGTDVICRGAPHIILALMDEDKVMAMGDVITGDAVIALTHFEIAAQAFGIGTCWAGVLLIASQNRSSLLEYLNLPEGRRIVNAMLFGYPQYAPQFIPERNPPHVTWR
jgi:nitroreductase/NAD-dependent dihydropyrimidine dehydrogenase PreA subunit